MNNLPKDLQSITNERNPKMVSFVFWFLAAVVFIAVDQYVKHVIFTASALLPNFVIPFQNFHFAFSLLVPAGVMFAIYFTILGFVAYHTTKNWSAFGSLERFAWVGIISGGLSNIVERVALGYVRDFLYIAGGIFNFADVYIIVGILLLLFTSNKKSV